MKTSAATLQSPDEHVVRTRVLASLDRTSASIPIREREFECAVVMVYTGQAQVSLSTAFLIPTYLPRVEHLEPFVNMHLAEMMNVVFVGGRPESVSVAQGVQDEAWAAQVYGLVQAGQYDEAMDLVYEHVDAQLGEDLTNVEALLKKLDPERLVAEVIVSVLIVTLAAKDRLPSRADFIARSRPMLDRESEGANEVLRGLE